MDYLAIRTFHESTVALSVTGFAIRGAGGLLGASWVRGTLARTLPHLVDTALLTSALMLVTMLHVDPFSTPWLQAKMSGLVVYIVLGAVALRPGLPRVGRACAGFGALAAVGWVVSVAFTKNPLGFLAFV